LDQKIFTPTFLPADAFPLSDPRKGAIKLGQLLMFTACIRGNNPGYVLPSLELVVWKLGGRDGQFEPRDTGISCSPTGPGAKTGRGLDANRRR
jgi:hypothetical protein